MRKRELAKDYNRIAVVMVDRGFKVYALARLMNVSSATLSLWRHNKTQPKLRDLYLIAEIMRVDVRELLVPNKL